MSFRIGQKVVCIDAGGLIGAHGYRSHIRSGLKHGAIYTITGFDDEPDDAGGLAFSLAEIDGLFYHQRFRPIVEKKTDISFAHEILRKVTRKQEARNDA